MNELEATLEQELKWERIPLPLCNIGISKKDASQKFQIFSKNKRMKILTAGRIEQRKGIDLIIAAQEQLEKKGVYTEVHCAGAPTPFKDGKTSIHHYKKRNNQNIKFLGHIPRTELLTLYQQYDIFCMPSRFESFGYVGAEAMYSGIPTIISDSSGLASYCENKVNTLKFKNLSIEDLCDKLTFAYENYDKTMIIAKEGQKLALENFNKEHVINMNITLFKNIIKQNNKTKND